MVLYNDEDPAFDNEGDYPETKLKLFTVKNRKKTPSEKIMDEALVEAFESDKK